MTLTSKLILSSALLGLAAGAHAQVIPTGTKLEIRTNERIDGRDVDSGRVYSGEVARDVTDTNDRVVLPRGARAELIVRRMARNEIGLDLDGIIVEGRHYSVPTSDITKTEGAAVGANGRTGKYVGGGAVFGTILGAIAGGGKGAAIGALAGGAAGAGAQTLTRGKNIDVPAESVLTFRLDRDLSVNDDRGYDRDGKHYHGDRR